MNLIANNCRWRSWHRRKCAVILCLALSGVLPACKDDSQTQQAGVMVLSVGDEQEILQEAGIYRAGSRYKAVGCDDDLRVEMSLTDLNGDNLPEVILRVSESPCFSGMMQSNIGVYVRSQSGKWRDALGFLPAFGVRVQEAKTKGYADIVLTVFGGCDQLYRWTGGSYYFAAQVPAYEGAKCSRK